MRSKCNLRFIFQETYDIEVTYIITKDGNVRIFKSKLVAVADTPTNEEVPSCITEEEIVQRILENEIE